MKNSFKLVTVLGIPVEINFSWFIIFGLVVYTLAVYDFPMMAPEYGPDIYWGMGLLTALLIFASLLLHELSHSYVARLNNLPISGITLFMFGGVAHLAEEPNSPRVEFRMAIAGPLMSFFLGTLFLLFTLGLKSLGSPKLLTAMAYNLTRLNFAVGIFNLVPGFPLDGGRILRSILWHFNQDLRRSTFIASSFGKGFAYFLIGLGFLSFLVGSLLSGVWFIFLGLFLMEAAGLSYQQVVLKKLLQGSRVENLMSKEVVTVPAALPLTRLVDDYFFKYRFTSFPVVEDDTILGLITFHEVKEVDKELWPTTPAARVTTPLNPDLLTYKGEDLFAALAKVARNGVGRLLVVEDSKLVGILSQKDIIRLFEFKSEVEGKS